MTDSIKNNISVISSLTENSTSILQFLNVKNRKNIYWKWKFKRWVKKKIYLKYSFEYIKFDQKLYQNFEQKLILKVKKKKLILIGIDEVLTSGEIIFDLKGNELKLWCVKEGLDFSIIKRIPNINVGWITVRKSKN